MTVLSPYSTHIRGFSVGVPEVLGNGDLLELSFAEYMEYDFFQIPLSVEYDYGFKNCSVFFQGGGQWSVLRITERDFEVEIESEGEEIYWDGEELDDDEKKRVFVKNIAGVNVGLGVGVDLLPQLQLRGTLACNYDFIDTKNNGFSNSMKTGATLRLGLNYRF